MHSGDEPLVRIRLLGTFEVERGGRVLRSEDWPRRKAAALFKRTALEGRLLRDQAVEFLWPDADPDSGANNLYKALHVARRALNSAFGPGTGEAVLRYEDGLLRLGEGAWVDARAFVEQCAAALSAQGRTAANLAGALALYRGDLLPDDRYEEWTALHREALRRQYRQAALALAEIRQSQGDTPGAAALLEGLLAYDYADEQAHVELMRLHALAGRRQDALRQYRACVDALAADLDAPPAPETTALYEQIARGEALAAATPPAQVGKVEAAAAGGPGAPRPVFVARRREMALLEGYLKTAAAGEGGVFFVTGEAGSGKTSLLAEFAYRAQAAVPRLAAAAGACQSIGGAADPYLPFRAIAAMLIGAGQGPWLRGDLPVLHAHRLAEIAPRAGQVFARYAPDLAGIITPAGTGEARAGGLSQRMVFDQFAQALRALAQDGPLLLLLDDLQWVDAASANLLFYLARQLRGSPVLIGGAYRPSEVIGAGAKHPLAAVVQELARYHGEILVDLDHLSPDEGRGFIDAFLDREANRLDATFREAVFRRTGGHALFTVELLRVLQEQQAVRRDEAGAWTAAPEIAWDVLPARVEAAIARRIERLPERLRRMVGVASVEGEAFSLEILAHLLGGDLRRMLHLVAHELDRRYRLVQEQGVERAGRQTVTRYQFRHSLFQQYLYGQLSAAERRYWHRQIAAVLEAMGAGDQDELAGTLARHCLAAGEPARAVPYLIRAGDLARRRIAFDEAAQYYQNALEHWPDTAEIPGLASADRAGVLLKTGEALLALGKLTAAVERFAEAGRQSAAAGDRAGLGAALRLTGRVHWEQANRAEALRYYHQAYAALEGEPESVELARVIAAIAQMDMLEDNFDAALEQGQRALALAQRLGAEDVTAHVLTTVGLSLAVKGEVERGLAMLAEGQARAEGLGLAHDACRAYAGLADTLVALERYDEARAVYEKMLAYARKVQAELFEGVALAQLGNLEWWTGQWRAALDRRRAVEAWMAGESGPSMAKVWAATLLAQMWNDLGCPAEARAVLDGYGDTARSAGEQQTTAPFLAQLARAADGAEQEGIAAEILALVDAAHYARYEVIPALLLVSSRLARESGGDRSALRRLEEASAQMRNRLSGAALAEAQGEAAALRGEWVAAAVFYSDAAERWAELGRPYDRLRAWVGLGEVYAKLEDRAALEEVRGAAAATIQHLAEELGGTEWEARFRRSPLARKLLGEEGKGKT